MSRCSVSGRVIEAKLGLANVNRAWAKLTAAKKSQPKFYILLKVLFLLCKRSIIMQFLS